VTAPGAEGGLTTSHYYAGASATLDRRDRDDPSDALADFGRRDDDDRDATDRPPPKDPVATLMSQRKFKSPPAPLSEGTEMRDARVCVDPTDALPEKRAFDTRPGFIFVPPPGPKVATFAFFFGAFFSSTSAFLAFFAAAVAFSFLRGNDTVAKLPRLPHETQRFSCGRVDGVEALWSHEDAVDATSS
jgi:hypothetical protein